MTSVDGVNVVSGETASPSQSGYVLDPYESVEISGWRKSLRAHGGVLLHRSRRQLCDAHRTPAKRRRDRRRRVSRKAAAASRADRTRQDRARRTQARDERATTRRAPPRQAPRVRAPRAGSAPSAPRWRIVAAARRRHRSSAPDTAAAKTRRHSWSASSARARRRTKRSRSTTIAARICSRWASCRRRAAQRTPNPFPAEAASCRTPTLSSIVVRSGVASPAPLAWRRHRLARILRGRCPRPRSPDAADRRRRRPDAGVRERRRRAVRRAVRASQGGVYRYLAAPLRQRRNGGRAVPGCLDERDPRARNLRADREFTTWLYPLAHNRLIDHWRATGHAELVRSRTTTTMTIRCDALPGARVDEPDVRARRARNRRAHPRGACGTACRAARSVPAASGRRARAVRDRGADGRRRRDGEEPHPLCASRSCARTWRFGSEHARNDERSSRPRLDAAWRAHSNETPPRARRRDPRGRAARGRQRPRHVARARRRSARRWWMPLAAARRSARSPSAFCSSRRQGDRSPRTTSDRLRHAVAARRRRVKRRRPLRLRAARGDDTRNRIAAAAPEPPPRARCPRPLPRRRRQAAPRCARHNVEPRAKNRRRSRTRLAPAQRPEASADVRRAALDAARTRSARRRSRSRRDAVEREARKAPQRRLAPTARSMPRRSACAVAPTRATKSTRALPRAPKPLNAAVRTLQRTPLRASADAPDAGAALARRASRPMPRASARRRRRARESAAKLAVPDWITLIRKLRDEKAARRDGTHAFVRVSDHERRARPSRLKPAQLRGRSNASRRSAERQRAQQLRIGAAAPRQRVVAREPHGARHRRASGQRDRTATRMRSSAEMREAVLDRRQIAAARRASARSVHATCARRRRRAAIRAGSTARPRCRSAGRFSSRIVPARSISSTRTARCGSAFRGRGDGSSATRSVDARDAIARDRTLAAARRGSRADRRAEIHQRLRVGSMSVRRQQRLGDAPQLALDLRRAGIAFDAAMAREHALHVAVEDRRRARRTRTRRSPPPSSGRCPAASRASPHRAETRRRASRHDRLRRRMQMMRAAVVAEAAPELEHAVDRRRGQRAHVGKGVEEALVVRDDRRDLRLLQHDLGQPDPIRVARALPRQIVAAVRPLPGDEARARTFRSATRLRRPTIQRIAEPLLAP